LAPDDSRCGELRQDLPPLPAQQAPQAPAAPTTFPLPKHPFERIALDWVGPLPESERGFNFLLNITDRLTKFAIAIPWQQTMTKEQLAEALYYVFCAYGIPWAIISDRDRRIDNDFFKTLSSLRGTNHRLTVSHRPQGNGQAEDLNKELVTKMKMYATRASRAAKWDLDIKECVYAYNTAVHTAHGFTPFFLTHDYHPSSLYTLYWPSTEPAFLSTSSRVQVEDFRQRHRQHLGQARQNLEKDAERSARRHGAPVEGPSTGLESRSEFLQPTCPRTQKTASYPLDSSVHSRSSDAQDPTPTRWTSETSFQDSQRTSTFRTSDPTLSPLQRPCGADKTTSPSSEQMTENPSKCSRHKAEREDAPPDRRNRRYSTRSSSRD
jgi:hypothetical protein